MFKKHLHPHIILFLPILLLFILEACNYKRAKHFIPTDSLPGGINLVIPQLIYPPNGSMDLDRNLTFEWQMVDQATAYDFQIIKEGESFQNANSFSQSGLTSNMYPVEGLEYQNNYQWRVRATAGDIFSDWSDPWGFTTMAEPIPVYELAVEKEGSGQVSSSPGAIDCGDTCKDEFQEGTEVTLIATPDAGWEFDGWSGNVPESCGDGSENCKIVMDGAKTVTATFVEEDPFETFIFEEVLVCIEHGSNESDILWLFEIAEFIGSDLEITMVVVLPDESEEEITLSSYSEAEALFKLDIFVTGVYGWEITLVKIDGEEIPFDGLTSGTINVTGSEENAGQCTIE